MAEEARSPKTDPGGDPSARPRAQAIARPHARPVPGRRMPAALFSARLAARTAPSGARGILDAPRVGSLAEIEAAKRTLLVTYRRDGTPVPTPVWAAQEAGRLCAEIPVCSSPHAPCAASRWALPSRPALGFSALTRSLSPSARWPLDTERDARCLSGRWTRCASTPVTWRSCRCRGTPTDLSAHAAVAASSRFTGLDGR